MKHREQRGASLIEALVAFLVLSLGMLGMVRLQSHLRLDADIARQRSEAVRLAQQEMETQRAFATLAATPGLRSYAQIASGTIEVDNDHSNTRFEIKRSVHDNAAAAYKSLNVALSWTDRNGTAQQLALDSIVAGSEPLLSASLVASARPHPLRGAAGRSPLIPLAAKDLGNGRSVFKPAASGTVALVFSNATGLIVGRCNAIASTTKTRDIVAADVAHCDAADAMLLSGIVRLSASQPPDLARANDTPLALSIELVPSGGPYPVAPYCASEIREIAGAGTTERFVAYHCMVTPLAGRWSGRSNVVPQGWTVGTAASQYKVCRYSADQDGSGSVDNNAEHPRNYNQVDTSLMQQNFLVIRGDQACPIAPSIGPGVFANQSTVQHQP